MSEKVVYILHKNGAKGHYVALDYLLKQNNITLKHREFSIFSKLFKAVTRGNFSLFFKQLKNIVFFISLLFTKNKKIVLGIAPFDSKLITILKFLKKHDVYYHTSWTCWNKTFHPKYKKNNPKTFKHWQFFLEHKVKHIFAVTNKSKQELLANYNINNNKISIVYHSNNSVFYNNTNTPKKTNSFIYVGRLLPQKGIIEILDFFKQNPKAYLTIVGDGKLKNNVIHYAKKHQNIHYHEPIYHKPTLINVFKTHEYVLLNSKKTKTWEELFGIIIIEAMSLGLIPIASNHSGPKEIITDKVGYIFNEGNVANTLTKVINKGFNNNMSLHNIEVSKQYSLKNISNRWKPILK